MKEKQFLKKGYPASLLKEAKERVAAITREDLLKKKSRKDIEREKAKEAASRKLA